MPLALADYPDSGHNVIWTLTLIAKAASAALAALAMNGETMVVSNDQGMVGDLGQQRQGAQGWGEND